ncbi:MAG: DUF4293 domain-containing protein [Bacteroidales bacterium]
MIQRIQSFYLLIVAIACTLLFFFPMIDYLDPLRGTYKLFATGMKSYADLPGIIFFWETSPLLILVCASLILAVIAIFLFKKRNLQLRLVNINSFINILLIGLVFLLYSRIFEHRLGIPSMYQFGMYIPLISLIFLVLASRAIRKDEELIKSSDRLR